MPPKKTTKKEEPPRVEVPDGFRLVDYEELDLLQCERCEFNTFDIGSAKAHTKGHTISDANADQLRDFTENLADHAQVTTTEDADE